MMGYFASDHTVYLAARRGDAWVSRKIALDTNQVVCCPLPNTEHIVKFVKFIFHLLRDLNLLIIVTTFMKSRYISKQSKYLHYNMNNYYLA